jgi:hypothetical protein
LLNFRTIENPFEPSLKMLIVERQGLVS